jgi:hypothetical protein
MVQEIHRFYDICLSSCSFMGPNEADSFSGWAIWLLHLFSQHRHDEAQAKFQTRTYHRDKAPSHQIIAAWAGFTSLAGENAMSIEIRFLQPLRILVNSAVQVDVYKTCPKRCPGILFSFSS